MSEWISVEDELPKHGARVRTRGRDGREFECGFYHWSPELRPYFKLIGKVWEHDNVTHWRPVQEK